MIRKIEKLTILGLGASIYDWINDSWANFGDYGELWTINMGCGVFRHDVVFDMHTDAWIDQLVSADRERIRRRREWLKTHDKPVIMPKAKEEIPTSVTYPLGEVIERTGSCYFATGVAYMLAMAYCCEVDELRLFGCDFSYDRNSNTHDEQGRACAEYWIGRLVGRGTRVATSNNTHFMDGIKRSKGRIYGYDEKVTFDFPADGGKGIFVGPKY